MHIGPDTEEETFLMRVVSAADQNKFIKISLKLLARKPENAFSKAKHNEMEINCIVPVTSNLMSLISSLLTVLSVILF